MKFYHWTTKENREKIKSEGVLRWVRNDPRVKHKMSRCTYLAVDKKEAEQYWDIVLEVEYDPSEHPKKNNYCDWCWQVRVYEPISIDKIRFI